MITRNMRFLIIWILFKDYTLYKSWTCTDLCNALSILLDNSYIRFGIYCETHVGQRFVVSFLRNIDSSNEDAYILVTSDHEIVNITINLRSLDNSLIQENDTIIKGISNKISVKRYFNMSKIVRNPVLELRASLDISVTAFIVGNVTKASYLALPDHALDNEYRAVTFCQHGYCACSITTSMIHTHVIISLTHRQKNLRMFQGGQEISITGKDTFILDKIENEFEQFYFEASSDLSGTFIKSNNPLTLLCGKVTKTSIWTLEQILPISKLGKILLPFPKMPRIQSSIKVVAPYNCTKIRMGRKIVLMDAGHVRIFKWTSIAQNKILSNAPVLVAQSFRVEANFRLQESMAIVPAETHYLTKYSFPQNVGNKFLLYVAISVSVKFTIKVKGTYNGTAEAKGQVLFKHKDSNGHNVDLDTELPISIPFLVYAYRRDRETTGKHDFDIMTNPVGFNFSSEVLVPRQIRDRHRCTSIGLPTTTLTTQRSKSTSQNGNLTDRASTVATTLQTTSSGFIDEMTTSGCSYESPKPPLHPPDVRTKNISQSLERKLQSIRKVLTIDKSNLSSTKRRKISASDDRKSARGIGFVGLTILCIVMGLIVLMDLPLLLSHVTILCRGTFGLAVEFARCRSNCSRRKQGLK